METINYGNNINNLINKKYGSFDKEEKKKQKKLLKQKHKEEKRQEKLDKIQKISFKEYLYNIYNLLYIALGFIACLLIMLYFVIGTNFIRIENLIDNNTKLETTDAKSIDITPYTVTDLTGTIWTINNNINATAGYGKFDVYYILFNNNNTEVCTGFNIGYKLQINTPTPPDPPTPPTWVQENGYIYNEAFVELASNNIWTYYLNNIEFDSNYAGSDASNSNLISWLQANATQQQTITQLTTPTITKTAYNEISWSAISNASSYAIYKDNVQITTTNNTSYTATALGTYQVMAIGDNVNYSDSSLSNSISLTATQLSTPTLSISDNIISWGQVSNANSYQVFKDNTLITTLSANDVFYVLTSSGTYQVKALSSSVFFADSSLSNSVTYTVPNLSSPTLSYDISYTNGGVLNWSFVTLSGLTQNFDIYKDNVYFATTQNHTYNVTENGVYKVKQISNLVTYLDSDFSNSVTISNLTYISYTLDNNITAKTYFDTNSSSTILSEFYFVLDSNNLPYTIFEIDNNNASTGYVFKSVNDFSTSSNVDFDITIINNQTIRVDYSSIIGNVSASIVDYSATKISGNTFYFFSETFTDNLVIGDYLLANRPFTSNERQFYNIFVNSYNYLVYDNNGSQENLVYFLSNLTGQYMNNSTYNYYLISFTGVSGSDPYFIQNYLSNDDIFFDYYRIATQSDLDNISALNDQLIYINENYTFMSLFGSIIDAHFNTLKSLLNFQFFGINLWSIFTLLLTVSLVFMALKFLRGGKKE